MIAVHPVISCLSCYGLMSLSPYWTSSALLTSWKAGVGSVVRVFTFQNEKIFSVLRPLCVLCVKSTGNDKQRVRSQNVLFTNWKRKQKLMEKLLCCIPFVVAFLHAHYVSWLRANTFPSDLVLTNWSTKFNPRFKNICIKSRISLRGAYHHKS